MRCGSVTGGSQTRFPAAARPTSASPTAGRACYSRPSPGAACAAVSFPPLRSRCWPHWWTRRNRPAPGRHGRRACPPAPAAAPTLSGSPPSLGPGSLTPPSAAARHAARIPSLNTSLCCGLAGVAYALLAVYRSTAAEDWLRQAAEVARRGLERGQPEPLMTNSLYKGPLALSVLSSDLRAPASAVMPMFEVERW